MSSGEGAEETTKDASDIAAFFKTGKPKNEWKRSDRAPVRAAVFGPAMQGTLFPSVLTLLGAQGAQTVAGLERLQPMNFKGVVRKEVCNK